MRFLLLISLLAIGNYHSSAQWNHVNSTWNNSYDLNFVSINETAGVLIAGGSQLSGSHIIKSTDDGNTWTTINTSSNAYNSGIVINASTYVVVGENGGGYGRIWSTTNGGSSWNLALSNSPIMYDVAFNGSTLVAVGESGSIRISTNNGVSWSTVTSGVSSNLRTVIWDPSQNEWIIGGDQHRLVSSDINAGSWVSTSNSYRITHLSFNSNLIETRQYNTSIGDSSAVIIYDNLGSIINQPRCGFQSVMKSVCTLDNRILAVGNKKFFEFNLIDNEFNIGVDSLYNPPVSAGTSKNILDLDICSSYAIAVGKNGTIAKYNLTDTLQTYAPADFYIPDTISTCPGSSFIAIPISSFADTYAWYMDNILVSTDDTLFGTWPNNNTSLPLKLITTTNGIQSVFINHVSINNYMYFPNYTLTLDTSLCYGEDLIIQASFQPGQVNGFYFQILANGNPIGNGPIAAQSMSQTPILEVSNMTHYTQVEIQLFKIGVCGLFTNSNFYNIHVGPDLSSAFTLVSSDEGICSGDSLHFSVNNLIQGATYELRKTELYGNSIIGPYPFDTIVGIGSDTLSLVYEGDQFYNGFMASPNVYADVDVTNYISAYVNYDGCSALIYPMVIFDITNPNAQFNVVYEPTLINDTLNIVNQQISDTTQWEIFPFNGIASNLEDTTPILAPNLEGEYVIKQLNTTRYGCFDSILKNHIVASEQSNHTLTNTCYNLSLPTLRIIGSKVDEDNNLVEIGYYSRSVPQFTGFCIRKIDSLGNLMWEKKLDDSYIYFPGTHLVNALEIDKNNNVYVAIRLKASSAVSGPFIFETFNLPGGYNTGYIIKWNATGQLLNTFSTGYMDITGMTISNDQLHVVGSQGVLTLSLDLNLIYSYPFNNQVLQPQYTYGSNTNALDEWKWEPRYPRIESLPNGKIFIISDIHANVSTLNVAPGITIIPNSVNSDVVFGTRYIPGQGFSNTKQLFEVPFNSLIDMTGLISSTTSDSENNLYLITRPKDDPNIRFFDSIVTIPSDQMKKTFLVKLDDALNPVWIKQSNILDGTIDYSKGADKLLLTGKLIESFYLGGNNDFKVIKGINYNENQEPFYAVINKNGSMIAGKSFGEIGYNNQYKIYGTASKCGDLFISQSSFPESWSSFPYMMGTTDLYMNINSTSLFAGTNLTVKISESNCVDDCQYLSLQNQASIGICYDQISLTIPYYESLNMDSTLYYVINNNNIVDSGFAQINNGALNIIRIFNPNDKLILYGNIGNPLVDTIPIYSYPYPDPLQSLFVVNCNSTLSLTLNPATYHDVTWYSSNGIINGNNHVYNSSDFILGDTVQYYVSFSDIHNCYYVDTFAIAYCMNLSLNESEMSSIQVFPNPAVDQITVNIEDEDIQIIRLEILDSQGKTILTSEDISSNCINIKNINNGFYFIKVFVTNQQGFYTFPFIKNG